MDLHIEERGAGPAVVFLHGSPSPTDVWAPVLAALSGQRTLVPHLPGYGRTPAPAGPVTLEEQAEQLERALLARGVREAAVAGYSLGGYRALQLAVRGRLKVTRLVLLGGFATISAEARQRCLGLAAGLRAGAVDLASVAAQVLLSPAFAAAHPEAAREVAGWGRVATSETIALEQEALAACEDLTDRLAGLRVPLVARTGTADLSVEPAASATICRLVPGAVLEEVPGAGHALLVEDREATVRSVCRALGG